MLFADREGFSPVDPADVEAPGGAGTRPERDTLGVAELQWLFQAPGGDESLAIEGAESAAHAWAGGEVARLPTASARRWASPWWTSDTGGALHRRRGVVPGRVRTDATESGGATVLDGGGQVGVPRCDGPDVRLGIAPDEATASGLRRRRGGPTLQPKSRRRPIEMT